jgi:hypothetical protein
MSTFGAEPEGDEFDGREAVPPWRPALDGGCNVEGAPFEPPSGSGGSVRPRPDETLLPGRELGADGREMPDPAVPGRDGPAPLGELTEGRDGPAGTDGRLIDGAPVVGRDGPAGRLTDGGASTDGREGVDGRDTDGGLVDGREGVEGRLTLGGVAVDGRLTLGGVAVEGVEGRLTLGGVAVEGVDGRLTLGGCTDGRAGADGADGRLIGGADGVDGLRMAGALGRLAGGATDREPPPPPPMPPRPALPPCLRGQRFRHRCLRFRLDRRSRPCRLRRDRQALRRPCPSSARPRFRRTARRSAIRDPRGSRS